MSQRRDHLRAADVDRSYVAEILKRAVDEGRLNLSEYDERLQNTYAARTYGDLDKVILDLPRPSRRSAILPIVEACVADKDVFASELVIRAYRTEKRVVEIPIRVLEKRPPSINLFKRVPNVLTNLAKLTWAIRVRG